MHKNNPKIEKVINKTKLKLVSLCRSEDAEALFVAVFSSINNRNEKENPSLLGILAFHAYPYFNNKNNKSFIGKTTVKECVKLLQEIVQQQINSEDNYVNACINTERGFAYPHQTERKIKYFGGNCKNLFIRQVGFTHHRLLSLVKYLAKNEPKRIFSKAELETRGILNEEEWQILIEKFIFTKEKSLNNILDLNDMRNYPLFALSKERILVGCSPHHFLEIIWELFVEIIESKQGFEIYNKNRKTYPEDLLVTFLKKIFPVDCIKKNINYPWDSNNYKNKAELDTLVIYDKTALIFEVKGGRHFRSSFIERKGRDFFYKNRLEDTLGKGFSQATRFKTFFNETPSKEVTKILKIDCSSVKKSLLCIVTFDHLANFSFNSENLKESEITFSPNDYPFTISIDDLEIILYKCQTPKMFIDYLEQRSQIKKNNTIKISDELDLFVYFLENGSLPINTLKKDTHLSGEFGAKYDKEYYLKWLNSPI